MKFFWLRIFNRRLTLKKGVLIFAILSIAVVLLKLIEYTSIGNKIDNEAVVVTQDVRRSFSSNLEILSPFFTTKDELKRTINSINREEKVRNEDVFGTKEDYSLVIVVQVHSRIDYLKHLIASLNEANDINNALLIFSHDLYDENINNVVKSINFCRVVQVFYPYSTQLYPKRFPGEEVANCSVDGKNDEKCDHSAYTNLIGEKRNPTLIQIKHHWWWKANKVFELKNVKNYKGPILFLEEDLMVVEDFIPMLRRLYSVTQQNCNDCKIISLADREDAVNIHRANYKTSNQAIITSIFHNLGLSFTREVWIEIQECARTFCTFDDYNWDYTLKYVFTNCMKNTAAVHLKSPRVFHIGACGVHLTSPRCKVDAKVASIKSMMARNRKFFNPDTVALLNKNKHERSNSKHGGFSDPRDHALCMGMTRL